MYDSVWVECPDCGRLVEFQSKAGKCGLNDYSITDVPVAIAGDLHDETRKCSNCDEIIRIRTTVIVTVF